MFFRLSCFYFYNSIWLFFNYTFSIPMVYVSFSILAAVSFSLLLIKDSIETTSDCLRQIQFCSSYDFLSSDSIFEAQRLARWVSYANCFFKSSFILFRLLIQFIRRRSLCLFSDSIRDAFSNCWINYWCNLAYYVFLQSSFLLTYSS